MATYQVTQRVEAIATASAATTSTAKSEAAAAVADAIEGTGADALQSVSTEAVDVYEFPSGPFDPYRITVRATVDVRVDADEERDALDAGEAALREIIEAADLDAWEFVGATDVTAPA